MYRIDIKNSSQNSIFLNRLLKLLVLAYVFLAIPYLLYKFFTLIQQHTSKQEWAAIMINLVIVILLAWQLIKTSNKKYILITDEFVKYRWRFPWASQIEWEKIKKIQFGYSSVRFITKSEKRHRFHFSKATENEKDDLEETLIAIAKKHNIEFMQPQ
jgi:Na+(H+)/acetate symporter ActP